MASFTTPGRMGSTSMNTSTCSSSRSHLQSPVSIRSTGAIGGHRLSSPAGMHPRARIFAERKEEEEDSIWSFKTWQRKLPWLHPISDFVGRLPPRWRLAVCMIWLLWKVFAFFILVFVLNASTTNHFSWLTRPSYSTSSSSSSSSSFSLLSPWEAAQEPLRVLYIVTSLAEYNTGKRKTVAGQDRLAEILLPVVADSVYSILTANKQQQQQQQLYKVDVYLILAYRLRPEREQFIRDHLPAGVGLQIWDDACPLGYDPPLNSKNVKKEDHHQYLLQENTRTLARQHRYVVRDKLPYYDLFLAFEDDMRITAAHVQHYVATSQALNILRQQAAQQKPANHALFYGPLTERQLDRIIPGFIRVEVLLDPTTFGAQEQLDPVPLDYNVIVSENSDSITTTHTTSLERHFNATDCCHVPYLVEHFQQQSQYYPLPAHPADDNVIVWETAIKALSVREMPANNNDKDTVRHQHQEKDYLRWVALLPGPGKRLEPEDGIPGYWSGQDIAAFDQKPAPGEPHFVAQQGGWILTREQILRLDRLCQGSFLPPFDEPLYKSDGQESMNVEYWSGSYQLITGVKGGCNMQRIVSLHPDHVSKHFIYHAANNKQRQLSRDRMVKADHLWGQLNSVRKAAEKAKAAILAHDKMA